MNITSRIALVLLISFAGFAAPCAAQSMNGLYVGGALTAAHAHEFCRNAALGGGVAGCDDNGIGGRVYAGYQVNNVLSVEAGWHGLGKAEIPGTDVQNSAFEIVAVGTVPIAGISLVGKFGAYRGESRGGGAASGINEHHGGVTYGAGLQYNLSREWALRGEWQRYPNMMGGRFGASTDIDALSIGALYRF